MKTILLALLAVSIRADLIVDTSPPNNNATDIVDSRLADAFTLTGASTVNDVNFWYQAQFQTDLSSVAYAFYSDSAGSLGSVVASGVATPSTSTDANAFLASFSIPTLALNPGTYWLELHAGSSLTDDTNFTIWWAASDATGTYAALQNGGLGLPDSSLTVDGFEQYAFQLEGTSGGGGGGTPTPEPSTVILFGGGLICLAIARPRRLLSSVQWALAAAAVLAVANTAPAMAAPITLSISATGSGSLNGTAFTNETLTITATTDTSAVFTDPFFSGPTTSDASGIMFTVAGVGSGTLSHLSFFYDDQSTGVLGFIDDQLGATLLVGANSAFNTYTLTSSLGPIQGSIPLGDGTFTNEPTSAGALTFTASGGTDSFEATLGTSGVPEPNSLVLILTCSIPLVLRWLLKRDDFRLFAGL